MATASFILAIDTVGRLSVRHFETKLDIGAYFVYHLVGRWYKPRIRANLYCHSYCSKSPSGGKPLLHMGYAGKAPPLFLAQGSR